MRGMTLAWLVLLAGGALLPAVAPVHESAEELLLREHKLPTDGSSLLAYLRKRLAPVDESRVKRLIEQLGDDSFAQREEASRQLLLMGDRVRKYLQEALRHKDLEVHARAEVCLRQIEKEKLGINLVGAAVRVVGWRQPPGATALLLGHLHEVEGEPLAPVIRAALADLAVKHGKADPLLVKALSSDQAWQRQTAVAALCQGGARDQLPALRKRLADPDRAVRLTAALGLVALREKEAVATLIDFMDQPLSGDVARAEEILFLLAGDKSPQLEDNDTASHVAYRRAWQAWWKEAGRSTDLERLFAPARPLGYTLVVLLDRSEILSLDRVGKVRWQFTGAEMPLDIQALPGDRVLLAEYRGNRVTERNSKGEVIWERKVAAPIVAQRLANGNTFIANKSSLIEVDRAGKEVASYSLPVGQEVMRARKLVGGDVVLIGQLGGLTRCYRLDRFGKELRSFPVEVATSGGRLDVTEKGELLIPEMNNNRVCAHDRDGKLIRTISVSQPIAALALPGDKVLVTSMSQTRAIEIDRAGKEVWQYKRDTRVTRAVRY